MDQEAQGWGLGCRYATHESGAIRHPLGPVAGTRASGVGILQREDTDSVYETPQVDAHPLPEGGDKIFQFSFHSRICSFFTPRFKEGKHNSNIQIIASQESSNHRNIYKKYGQRDARCDRITRENSVLRLTSRGGALTPPPALPTTNLQGGSAMSDSQFSRLGENWKAISGFPGYEVSDQGRVRSYLKSRGRNLGTYISTTAQKILKPHPDRFNRLALYLRKDGKTYRIFIHRLVLIAFVSPYPLGMETCHNDGNPANNNLTNLRWDTRRNNAQDTIIHGTVLAGSKNPRAKLNESQVIQIREMAANGIANKRLAEMFSVYPEHISGIIHRKYWTHI